MKKRILIDANFPTETRVAVLDKNNNVEAFEYDNDIKRQIKNNIYLAKVTRVEPSLQAAFVDYGDEKSGFLPFSEIHHDYFNIPVNDRKDHLQSLSEITPPKITSEDKVDSSNALKSSKILDSEDVDIDAIEKLVDEKIQPDFDLEADDSDIEVIGKGNENTYEDYKIQEVIKKGQILLVQATKEERGNKGASFTTYLSLAGKYCVLMPNKPSQNGISRKIANADERRRLRDIISSLSPEKNNASIIVRTAGAGHTSLDIKRDYEYLSKLWNKIRETTLKSTAPSFIHQEDSILLKAVRDLFDKNVKEVLIQGPKSYEDCVKFVGDMMPTERNIVKEYKSKTPIFTKFRVEEQLTKLYQTNVQLPSGGYIVINPTEALISIDVNSGRSTQERSIEEMALKTNMEAAREIARQARLRDLSGLLVLDFIDMGSSKNRKIVERTLREFMSKDKARIQMAPISTFGLLELSRQRLRPSFLEVNSVMCTHCSGKGIIRADEANSMLILRTIENEIFNSNYDVVNVYGIASSMIYLLNNKRTEINFVEKKYNIKLNFYIDKDATSDSYSIEKVRLSDSKKNKDTKTQEPLLQDTANIYSESEQISKSRKKIDTRESKRETTERSNEEETSKTPLEEKKKKISRKNRNRKNSSQNASLQEREAESATPNAEEKNKKDKTQLQSTQQPDQQAETEHKSASNDTSVQEATTKEDSQQYSDRKKHLSAKKPKGNQDKSTDKKIDENRPQEAKTVVNEPVATDAKPKEDNQEQASKAASSGKKRIAKKAASKNAPKKSTEEKSGITTEKEL